jgi:hypothetical protein
MPGESISATSSISLSLRRFATITVRTHDTARCPL